ncbi:MAG: hypothetical protein KF851_10850 [Pirellulaceae bacterium]|nr:hypothetical protein [Pirellulaceae bacterium]
MSLDSTTEKTSVPPKSILIVASSAHRTIIENKIARLPDRVDSKFVDVTEEPSDNTLNDAEGVLIQATSEGKLKKWCRTLNGRDLPYCSFLSPEFDIESEIRSYLRPEHDIATAFRKLMLELSVSLLEKEEPNYPTLPASSDSESRQLDTLLKQRFQLAMEIDQSQPQSLYWDKGRYTRHLQTLISVVRSPFPDNQRGTPSSAQDIASCIYAAQLTKRLLALRFMTPNAQKLPGPSPLIQPLEDVEAKHFELGVPWESVFSLIFAFIDFIPDIEFRSSFVRPDDPGDKGVAIKIRFATPPHFSELPEDLKRDKSISSFASNYKSCVEELFAKTKGNYWDYDETNSSLRLSNPKD